MIYVFMRGRIGNQLFIQGAAEALREKRGRGEEIVVDDSEVLMLGWENSLPNYPLEQVSYVHSKKAMLTKPTLFFRYALLRVYRKLVKNTEYTKRFSIEQKLQKLFNRMGIISCENGFLEYDVPTTKYVLLDGYYQSEKYFEDISDRLQALFSSEQELAQANYPGLAELRNRNSVCISVKVEHNVGSSMYDVCNHGYWERAIQYITEHVENPLFFICSDNVEYVKEHLIDCTKFDCIAQAKNQPVHLSLAAMAQCKHFAIGNTTFGWWAQYLSKHDIEHKIVIAPSKWMAIDMPIDIYQKNWHLEEV